MKLDDAIKLKARIVSTKLVDEKNHTWNIIEIAEKTCNLLRLQGYFWG